MTQSTTTRALVGRMARWLGLGLVAAIMSLASASLVAAQDIRTATQLAVAAPEEVPLAGRALIVAILKDAAGAPVKNAKIRFFSPATLGGTVGEMEVGEAVTDEDGNARLAYQLRTEGRNRFTGRFFGDERYQPSQASAVTLATGSVQVYQPKAGIQLPIFGGWTLAAVLLGVWSVYFGAMFLVTRIAGDGKAAPSQQVARRQA